MESDFQSNRACFSGWRNRLGRFGFTSEFTSESSCCNDSLTSANEFQIVSQCSVPHRSMNPEMVSCFIVFWILTRTNWKSWISLAKTAIVSSTFRILLKYKAKAEQIAMIFPVHSNTSMPVTILLATVHDRRKTEKTETEASSCDFLRISDMAQIIIIAGAHDKKASRNYFDEKVTNFGKYLIHSRSALPRAWK